MSGQSSSGGNYYDNQFGDRIDNIRNDGAPLRAAPRSSGWGGRAGVGGGVGVAVLVCIRLLVAGCVASNNYSRSQAVNSQYQYQATPAGSSAAASPWAQQRDPDEEVEDPAERQQRNAEFQREQQQRMREELERQARERKPTTFGPQQPTLGTGTKTSRPRNGSHP